jgi:hypothetical protein
MPETCTAEQADFRKAWQQNGTAKVAGFLSPHELGELRTAVDASYGLLRQHADDDPPTLSGSLADHYKRWDGIWLKELQLYLGHAKPGTRALLGRAVAATERGFRSLFDRTWFDRTWRPEPDCTARPDLRAQFDSAIAAVERRFRSLFDRHWRLEPKFSFVRRHRSTRLYLPWHIDADAAGIINTADYCINTWLPLDPVGDVLPSLELMPGSNKTMRTVPSLEGPEKTRTNDWVKANFPGESWIPHAAPGDAILFDHWTLHRTQCMVDETAVRTSCEFRFVRTSRSAIRRPI